MVGVLPVPSGLRPDLVEDLPDRELVELARQHDRRIVEPGGIELPRACTARYARSPESRRIPTGRWPSAQPLEHVDGVGDPGLQRVDRVDQEQAVVGVGVRVGLERSELALAECDEQLDHRMGMGSRRWDAEAVPDGRVDVETAPPISAAREAASAPSPGARRMPNSSTGRPSAASTIRDALVAMSVGKLSRFNSGVSMSCAATSGPSTTVIGVFGCTTLPSGTADRRRPPKSTSANHAEKSSA